MATIYQCDLCKQTMQKDNGVAPVEAFVRDYLLETKVKDICTDCSYKVIAAMSDAVDTCKINGKKQEQEQAIDIKPEKPFYSRMTVTRKGSREFTNRICDLIITGQYTRNTLTELLVQEYPERKKRSIKIKIGIILLNNENTDKVLKYSNYKNYIFTERKNGLLEGREKNEMSAM